MAVTISDAQPVQYWLNGKQTFNQKQPAFVSKQCFHQVFKCDSPIRSQLIDTDLSKDYLLQIFDSVGQGLATAPFIKSFLYGGDALFFNNEEFTSSLGSWTNLPGSDRASAFDWAWFDDGTEGTARISESSGPGIAFFSKYLAQERGPALKWPPGKYAISVRTESFGSIVQIQMFGMVDTLNQTALGTPQNLTPGIGKQDFIFEFNSPQEFQYLAIGAKTIGVSEHEFRVRICGTHIINSPGAETSAVFNNSFIPNGIEPNLCETKFKLQIVDAADTDIIIAYSDILQATLSIVNGPYSGAIEIKYRSFQNVFGLAYNESSDFNYLYIIARFFHQEGPIRQKIVELSDDDTVVTATGLTQQRKLTVGDCPDYLHQKIKLALQHAASGEVEIDEDNWILISYAEKIRSQEEFPLKPAEATLLNRKYLKRNLI